MEENKLICVRCGMSWFVTQNKRKKTDVKCESCRMRPALSIKYGLDTCIPWRGEFDLEDNPVADGVLFLPGVRSCKHKDCVNGAHIVVGMD